MLAYTGERSLESQRMVDFIGRHEWGLMILDEVQTVPAKDVCDYFSVYLYLRWLMRTLCCSFGWFC